MGDGRTQALVPGRRRLADVRHLANPRLRHPHRRCRGSDRPSRGRRSMMRNQCRDRGSRARADPPAAARIRWAWRARTARPPSMPKNSGGVTPTRVSGIPSMTSDAPAAAAGAPLKASCDNPWLTTMTGPSGPPRRTSSAAARMRPAAARPARVERNSPLTKTPDTNTSATCSAEQRVAGGTDPRPPHPSIGATAAADFVELVRFTPRPRPRWSRPRNPVANFLPH